MEGPINNDNIIPNQFNVGVPTKVNTWTKIKNFLFQEIKIELTPRQAEVFGAINDFWHQEVDEEKVHSFLFQKMNF